MITEAGIKAAMKRMQRDGKASLELRDDGPRGGGRLVVLLRRRDQKFTTEWYAQWWRDEKRKTLKFGVFPEMTVAEARATFQADYAPLILKGKDPTGPKARRERKGVTVKDLFEGYIGHLEAQGKPSAEIVRHILLSGGGAAKALGEGRRAADVTAEDLREHLASIHGRGSVVMAKEARGYLHAAFAWAMKSANDYTSAAGCLDWGIAFNPVAAIPTDKSEEANRARDRHLSPAELRTVWNWLQLRREDFRTAPVLMLTAATGQRVSEILKVSEPSYDRAEKMVDWSKTKNGMPHSIPLPSQAVDILDTCLQATKAGALLFPHMRRPGEHATYDSVEKVVNAFLDAHPGFKRFTPRDLRRTWKTLAGAAGLSKEVRDRIQNHARVDISSRHYDRYDYLPEKRVAMETWSAYLTRILSGELDNPITRVSDPTQANAA